MLPEFCAVKELPHFGAKMPVVADGDFAAMGLSQAAVCTCSLGRCVTQPEGKCASDLAV